MEQKMGREVKLRNMISYGVGDLFGGGSFFIIGALFLLFLTDAAGLSPAKAGTLIALGKIWDAVIDPAIGYITDHTKSKYGRRRIYFLIGIVPIFLSFLMLWIPLRYGENFEFFYYLFAYMLFCFVFSFVMIPYNTLGAEMTSDYKVRSKMTGIRMFFSQFSVLLGGYFPRKIIAAYPGTKGYIVMGAVFGLLFALPWIFVYRGTWEKENVSVDIDKEPLSKEIRKVFRDFASVLENKSFKLHISMYLSAYLAMDVFNALMLFFVTYYLHMEGAYSNTLAIMVLAQVASIAAVTYGCMKNGNAATYRIHMIIWALAIFVFGLFTPNTAVYSIYIIAVLIGFGLSGAVMVPWNILPFISDVDEVMTSKRREGIYAGFMTFIRQIAQAIALFFVGLGLQGIGYRANQVQSEATLRGLHFMIIYVPIIIMALGIIASFYFKINAENHRILMNEVERLKNGGNKNDVSSVSKAVCEELTGKRYENLWM